MRRPPERRPRVSTAARLRRAAVFVLYRTARIALLLAAVVFIAGRVSPTVGRATGVMTGALLHDRVDGLARLMSLDDRFRMSWYLEAIARETGIDVRLLCASPPAGESLERFAASQASRRGIGREGGMRGILVILDPETDRLRVELGYGLEAYFSDAFIGYLLEHHAAAFFRAGDPTTGLRLMIRILHERIRDQMLGGTFDPAPFDVRGSGYVSGGAGASAATPLGDERRAAFRGPGAVLAGTLDPERKRYFGPQPTAEAAFERYLEWLADGAHDSSVELLTPGSRDYLYDLPLTRPHLDHVIARVWGERYAVVERGDVAMVYWTSTPLVSPSFLVRTPDGWTIDLVEEVLFAFEVLGYRYTWSLTQDGVAWNRFGDMLIIFDSRFIRIADGDNRPLPIP